MGESSLELPEPGLRSIVRSNLKKLTTTFIIQLFSPQNSVPTMKTSERKFSDLTVKKSCASLEQHVLDFSDTMNLKVDLYFLLYFALGNSEPNMEPTLSNCEDFLVCIQTLPLV